jgi:hypothetical protein
VSDPVTPALIAAGGGSVMLAGIWARERRADEAMRATRVRLSLRFPVGLDPQAAFSVLDSFSGLPPGIEVVLEMAAGEGRIAHYLWVPEAVRASVESMLRGAVPSLRIEEVPLTDGLGTNLAMRFFIPTPSLLNTDNAAAASRTLLAGLTGLHHGEHVVLRWALRAGGPRRRPEREPEGRTAKDIDRAWRRKTAQAGMRAAGLLLVRSDSMVRARMLAAHVESMIRSRRGLTGAMRVTTGRGNRSLASMPRTTGSSGWLSSAESLGHVGWPLGPDVPAGVEVGAARQLAVSRHVPRDGRRLFVGRDAGTGAERPVALSVPAASRHLALVGSTGAGKSSVLGCIVLDALAAGHGGILLDPKDLARELIDRVPPAYADRVAVFDPAVPGFGIGLDLFGGGDPYFRSDVILSVLRAVSESWGPRIDQHLRMGLQTVAALERPVLSDWLRLYREPELRRQAIARLDDPFLVAEWRIFEESLSAAEQFQHTAPAISRINHLLSRPALRSALSQRDPKLNVGQLLEEGRWLFVSLNSGAIGEPVARLLGAIIVYLAWTAIEGRVALPPAMRRPVVLALDELQSLASLPVGLEAFFERARSMNCSVVAATQTTGRLPESLRDALLGNVGSLVTFRVGYKEAARIAHELPGLSADDLLALGRFEVAARIATADETAGHAIVTGRTEPLPPITGQGRVILERSARDYGQNSSAAEREPRHQEREPGQIGSKRRTA